MPITQIISGFLDDIEERLEGLWAEDQESLEDAIRQRPAVGGVVDLTLTIVEAGGSMAEAAT